VKRHKVIAPKRLSTFLCYEFPDRRCDRRLE
jgi:hypothetical protein